MAVAMRMVVEATAVATAYLLVSFTYMPLAIYCQASVLLLKL